MNDEKDINVPPEGAGRALDRSVYPRALQVNGVGTGLGGRHRRVKACGWEFADAPGYNARHQECAWTFSKKSFGCGKRAGGARWRPSCTRTARFRAMKVRACWC